MRAKSFLHPLLALTLVVSYAVAPFAAALAQNVSTQQTASVQTASASDADLAARLDAIEKAVEAKRKETGVPGFSLVIVKDDRVIFMKGFGQKDVERNLPVTPDTLFAIGSCTKAFTAMLAMMSVDDGKLSLDDSPKKYLPYFKLRDAEVDARVTVRDMLLHRTGLDNTDLAWYTGALNREEVIRTAMAAKPTAKLGEKFQYQNVMYSAAGEVVAHAQKTTWEELLTRRILSPLGMSATRLTVREMQSAPDYSFGYDYKPATKQTVKLATRDLTNIAAAGAINSNARDMAQWLRLLLNRGAFGGKRLISEKSFDELLTPQIKINEQVSYALGWGVAALKKHRLISHTGGIDGFGSLVELMPDDHIGYALLTNVEESALGGEVRNIIWANMLDDIKPNPAVAQAADKATPGVDPQQEAGTYRLEEARMNIEVTYTDGHLVLNVPGQPAYTLENVGGRRYKLAQPPVPGFFVTFRPVKDKTDETEIYLEQPQGNYVLARLKPGVPTDASKSAEMRADTALPESLRELVGSYKSEKDGDAIEVALREGKLTLVTQDGEAYPLVEKEKDVFGTPGLPDSYRLLVTRDTAGKVNGIIMRQPEGEISFKRVASAVSAPANISVDELVAKAVAAAGGEANLRKHKTLVATFSLDFENQGINGNGTLYSRAPGAVSHDITLTALGKKIGTIRDYFDGSAGGEATSFLPASTLAGAQLADTRNDADFYGPLDWKQLFKSIEIMGTSKVGDEDAYVVRLTPEKGHPVTAYVSTKSFLVIKRDSFKSSGGGETAPVTEIYSDFRTVDGVLMPFTTTVQVPVTGTTVMVLKEVKFDAAIPDSAFRP